MTRSRRPHRLYLAAVPLFAAALALACNATTASAAPPAPFETLVQTAVPGQQGKERRDVFRDEATWRAAWAELREGSSLPPEPPAVDFAKDMVVLAAMATQPCVSKVTIRTIIPAGQELAVDLLEEPSGPNCTCITSQRPFHAVSTPKAATVRFDATVQPKDCAAGK